MGEGRINHLVLPSIQKYFLNSIDSELVIDQFAKIK